MLSEYHHSAARKLPMYGMELWPDDDTNNCPLCKNRPSIFMRETYFYLQIITVFYDRVERYTLLVYYVPLNHLGSTKPKLADSSSDSSSDDPWSYFPPRGHNI